MLYDRPLTLVTRRWLLIAAVTVASAECLVWLVAGAISWATRYWFVGPDSPVALDRTRFAMVVFAALGANVLALLVFVLSRSGWSWWSLATIQVGDFLSATVEGVSLDVWWFLISGLSALAIVLLYLERRSGPKLALLPPTRAE